MALTDLVGVFAVFLLVAANGFFVAAEFSLVAVRRSRVVELIASGRRNAKALLGCVEHLDATLAATQLGITLSSLALGWIGEPALSHLIQPLLEGWAGSYAEAGSHAIAIAIAFILITIFHIVLGELAPKSLALQRSEGTALWVVRPLMVFEWVFRPAISLLNGLGNLVLRLVGLQPGAEGGARHSTDELKLLIGASREAGLLQRVQEELVDRVFNIGDRPVGDIMTPRVDVEWVDADLPPEELLAAIRACPHSQLLVGRGDIDDPLGMLIKHDLLHQVLDGAAPDPLALVHEPLVIPEGTPVFRVLEAFRSAPVRMAIVVNEYGGLEGIVTQTDLLMAIAGQLPDVEGEAPEIVARGDGSYLLGGMASALEVFERLGVRRPEEAGHYHTIAGFALARLRHLPRVGEAFEYDGWRFKIAALDKRRVHTIVAKRLPRSRADDGEED
ncbi:MAG: HlyC/CorC family transporter [Nevskiaceae bacterium]|nr:MAG: HlyC/CorC family transporter [Nevskiaceae bacterium]TBR73062.1 MAG: HlyC/CorC family transporter [Nevskiaceae bacterium]